MSSPQEIGVKVTEQKKQISFQFCAECSNMLYPKEDEESRTLQFTCRTCHYTTNATNTCVFRNELSSTANLHAGIIEGMGKDPTVGGPSSACALIMCLCCGRDVICSVCGVSPFCMPVSQAREQKEDKGKRLSWPSILSGTTSLDVDTLWMSDDSDDYDFLYGMDNGNDDQDNYNDSGNDSMSDVAAS